MQYVDFATASSSIDEEYTKRLETIANVLYDRPGLKMDIKGNVNAAQETDALHNIQFERLVKNEKYKKISKKKDAALSLDEITVEPDEYKKFLKIAYKEATFEKPKNAIGLTKRLPPEEMEKLLRDNIIITEDDLRLLAIERANQVKSFLVEAGPVEPERIFIIEPAINKDTDGAPRVDIVIK